MTKTKRTPGKLKIKRIKQWVMGQGDDYPQIVSESGQIIVNGLDLALGAEEANAERLVACWNACEGINPEAVPDLLEALEGLLSTLSPLSGCMDDDPCMDSDCTICAARAAIAKAKGLDR